MRTDAVRMFFIHYLTQLEKPFKSYDPVLVNVNEGALLHYKTAPIINGDIWGQYHIEKNFSKETLECLHFEHKFESLVEANNRLTEEPFSPSVSELSFFYHLFSFVLLSLALCSFVYLCLSILSK